MLLTRLTLGILVCILLASPIAAQEQQISFKRDIRPILSDNCFYCHGPDHNHRQAGLRLDTHEGASAAIDLERPEESPLLQRVLTHDLEERMPPPKSNKQLTEQQIEKIRQWIKQGAPWEEHWSFTPLVAPQPPQLAHSTSLHNPIDAFVQSQLAQNGWAAAPEADRRTLIRRVTLDLTGLPPTQSEVDAFLNDTEPGAYERVVARLLQSSAYGERMAWEWLDAARYADSNGYQGDNERTMWPWRDWVVQAFNQNLPFDQFTVWQLAGDMLPDATLEEKLATGFCRNHMINGEGGRIAEENRVDYVMDMTETVGTVWLGLTLNCCRCHDHKFDPILQREYYQLFAFFNQTPVDGGGGNPQTPPVLAVPSRDQQSRLDAIDQQLRENREKTKARTDYLATQRAAWETAQRDGLSKSPTAWQICKVTSARAQKQKLNIESDQSVLVSGENPSNDNYTVELQPSESTIAALRLETLQHASLTKDGLSRTGSGNFVLTGFEVYVQRAGANDRQRLVLKRAEATFEQGGLKVQTTLDDDPKTGWGVWDGRNVDRPHTAAFYLETSAELHENDRLIVELKHESQHAQHLIGRFRISTSAKAEVALDSIDSQLAEALKKPTDQRSEADEALLLKRLHRSDQQFVTLETERQKLDEQRSGIMATVPNVMVMAERPEPRTTTMLDRGLYNAPRDKVDPAVPASLPPLPANVSANRLALARWLVSSEQPLTARVVVNRFWQQFFGVGLVKTVEDFGSQGEVPRYLDLLDWLASDFRDSGWNVKHLVELIVTSHTYRQSSLHGGSSLAKDDPENRWLARGARFRMPSWMIRDQALAACGLLVRDLGGPSVNGYQPDGIWEEATFGQKKYARGNGDALYRRSLYTFWRRIVGPPMFFDNASRQVCTVKVVRTNTPLQALFTLNDVTFVEAARALAAKTLQSELNNDRARVDFVFQRILARPASDAEAKRLIDALEHSVTQFQSQPEEVKTFLSVGDWKAPAELDAAKLASWSALCLAVLNLDETLTKE
ncbi:MAG: PSD1 and planctomycete cytochrome C domain-containing protein [Pirellulaceae bacterium]|nr:PSD1 and planctomycete cytochrome C domain-containing protein [Pirellulaceae bacterium]